MKTNVVRLDYLMAIMLQTYRAKDRERLVTIMEETKFDLEFLTSILRRKELAGLSYKEKIQILIQLQKFAEGVKNPGKKENFGVWSI